MPAATAFLDALPPPLRELRPVAVIAEALRRNRLAHAILLHAEDPAGREQVASALAAALLETDPARVHQHPDLFTLRPAGKARRIRIGEDSRDSNTMRELLHAVQQTPNQGRRKVAIVHEVDRMNAATANAFLKTLEEPPSDTTLLLLTARPHDLLPTIRSRCFSFRLSIDLRLSADTEWTEWLADYHAWLSEILARKKDAATRANLIFTAYALIVRFQSIVSAQSKAAWDVAKEKLPSTLDDDEVAATEAGFLKGLRDQRLADIAKATAGFAASQADSGDYPVVSLAHSLNKLEEVAGLLEVNLKDDAALEIFFLASLRAWSRSAQN